MVIVNVTAPLAPSHCAFTADTKNVWVVPLINHVTVIGLVDDEATINHVIDLILYDNISDHPLVNGASNSNIASPLVPAASMFCGTHGTVTGVTLFDGALETPVHNAVLAVTTKAYDTQLVRPSIKIGLDRPVNAISPDVDVTI